MKTFVIAILAMLFLIFSNPVKSFAQIDVKGKLKSHSIDQANQSTDEGIDAAMNATEDGVKNSTKKKDDNSDDGKKDNDNEKKDNENSQQSTSTQTQTSPAQASLSSYSKFDFIPGDKVIFYDDFSQDALADFPGVWNTNGSGEVTTTNLYPGNWFKMKAGGSFIPEVEIPFNENFTFECDLIFKDAVESNSTESFDINFIASTPEWKVGDNYTDGCWISLNRDDAGAESFKDGQSFFNSTRQAYSAGDMPSKRRVSIWIQKQRLRLYINDAKILDLPRLLPPALSCNTIEFISNSFEGNNSLMTNVRIAYGAPDTRNKLLTVGKLVTYGITFDVNSDKVKPESYGTLKDIASVLKDNPDVKVKIIGHTDGDGDATNNLDLSKRRAASVKKELTNTFAIDASRIETDGKGKTEPIAPNDTPANKAQNRRVEFIKL
jgi:OmpA-OmpF porin, OOP family